MFVSIKIMILALLPLGYIPWGINPQLPKFFMLACVVGISAISFFFKIQKKTVQPIPKTKSILLHSLWMFWLFYLWVACFFCQDQIGAWNRFVNWLILALLHFSVLDFQVKDWKKFCQCILITGTITAIYGLAQSLSNYTMDTYPTYTATFGNVGYAGAMMSTILLFSPLLFTAQPKTWKTYLNYGANIILFWYLVRTGSRAAWLSFILGGGFFLRMFLADKVKNLSWQTIVKNIANALQSHPIRKFMISLVFLGLLVIPLIQQNWREAFVQRISHSMTTDWKTGSMAVRKFIWQSTLSMIHDHSNGVGPGQFKHRYYLYRNGNEYLLSQGRLVDHPHNSWLLAFSECGVLGIWIITILLFFTTYLFTNSPPNKNATLEDTPPNPLISQINIVFLGVWINLLILSLFTDVWQTPETGMFIPLITGWLAKNATPSNHPPQYFAISYFPMRRFLSISLQIVLGIMVLGILSFSSLQWIADIYLDCGQKQLQQKNYPQAQKLLEKAVFLYPNDFHRLEYGRSLLATRNYLQAISVFAETIHQAPELEGAYIDLGLCYYALEQYSHPIKIWKYAQAYFPYSGTIYSNLITLLLQLREGDSALDYLFRWSYFCPTIIHELSYQLKLAQAYQFAGNSKEAILCYAKAKENFPQSALPYLLLGKLFSELNLPNAAIANLSDSIRFSQNQKEKCETYCAMGYAIQQEGQNNLAKTYFLKAKSLDENNVYPYLYLSQLSLELKQEELAMQYLQKAKQIGFSQSLISPDPSLQKLAHSQIYQSNQKR